MKVPSFMLKKLYVEKSLANENGGVTFRLRNTMATATLVSFPEIAIDGIPLEPKGVTLHVDGETVKPDAVSEESALRFVKNGEVKVYAKGHTLRPGPHLIAIRAESREWQTLAFEVEDEV